MYIPNSLLRQSVTGGELHRHWAFFTGTGLASYRQTRAPPCATLDLLWADRSPGRHKGGKGDASGAPGDHRSSAGGRVVEASPTEGLPPGVPWFRVPWGGAFLLPPSRRPQRVSLVETGAAMPGSPIDAAT